MVDEPAIERLGSSCESSGRAQIGLAWPWIAARMIMGNEDPNTGMAGSVNDDLPEWKLHAASVAAMAGEVEAAGLVIEMRDPQALQPRVQLGKAAGEELACGGEAVKLQRKFDTLMSHAAAVSKTRSLSDLKPIAFGG